MFKSSLGPRFFGLAPGVDFPRGLVAGLKARLEGMPPHQVSNVELIVNTRRMARRIRTIFEDEGPGFVPRIRLVTDVADHQLLRDLPDPVSPLRRRLEVVQLVRGLLASDPTLAAQSSAFDLAESLASLIAEMKAEGVDPETVLGLDVSDSSGHWQRAQAFLGIVAQYFETTQSGPDAETLSVIAIDRLTAQWKDRPPETPVILAGSTGSRGHTARLMQAVARLPQGAVVLPGVDPHVPETVWRALEDPMTGEDHPQYRFAKLMRDAGLTAADIRSWHDVAEPDPERNRVVSLSLRPAPVTDQWLDEGPVLPDLRAAMQSVTLVETEGLREEAAVIALRLRQAAQDGQTAALITPDRTLTRRVAAILDRWRIKPDDSAGEPLPLTPPGRFLRHVCVLMHRELTSDTLLTLLKHPLTHSGARRNDHLRLTRDLELEIRKTGIPFPSTDALRIWGDARGAPLWGNWLASCFEDALLLEDRALSDLVAHHVALAERLAGGADGGTGGLWDKAAGRSARSVIDRLVQEAEHGGEMLSRDYADLFAAVLATGEDVRETDDAHPDVLIWGTLEARVQGAELVILGGMNDGSWPELPAADPWLNRRMRLESGLLLPERRIGLSAHDYQQAIAAPEVWVTRSLRSDDAQTVPSRWINRLTNLLDGLPDQNGRAALAEMRARGAHWLALASELDRPIPVSPAVRPSVVAPVSSRPNRLSVTRIRNLIRDPYAIYARHVLRLEPLGPLFREADAMLRGTVLHDLLETFVTLTRDDPARLTARDLSQCAAQVLRDSVPWATTRHLWQARIDRIADWFVAGEMERQKLASMGVAEVRGMVQLPNVPFVLTAQADRIDITPDGQAVIYDYKTGSAPSPDAQKYFEKQLLLEAAMVENGGWESLGPRPVLKAEYVSLGATPTITPAPLDTLPASQVWSEFCALMEHYFDPDTGYTARRAQMKERDVGDFDHLARYGEWDETDEPVRVILR